MIRLELEPEPQVLIENQETWTSEYRRWISSRDGNEPRRYAHDQIRNALKDVTASKCAYCEAYIDDVSYAHIEHIRPKKKHPSLVCVWNNLTIACTRCNTNKGDYDDEDAALLNPYIDDPGEEVSFYGPLALPKGGARSRLTISTLKLNRMELLFSRSQLIERICNLLDLIERSEGDVTLQRALWIDVDRLIESTAEFSSACRYFVLASCRDRGLERP